MEAYHGRGSQAYSGLSLSRLPPERGGGAQRIPAGGVRQRTALPLRQILSPGGADGRPGEAHRPCLFCGKDHTVTCSSHAFLHEKVLAFSCAASGLDCCYVGERGRCLPPPAPGGSGGQAGGRFRGEGGLPGRAGDAGGALRAQGDRPAGRHLLHLRLPPLEAPGQFQLHRPVLCRLRRAMRIPAATASDIDDICCKNKLVIHGQD